MLRHILYSICIMCFHSGTHSTVPLKQFILFATFDIQTVKGLLSLQESLFWMFEPALGRNPVFGKFSPPFWLEEGLFDVKLLKKPRLAKMLLKGLPNWFALRGLLEENPPPNEMAGLLPNRLSCYDKSFEIVSRNIKVSPHQLWRKSSIKEESVDVLSW